MSDALIFEPLPYRSAVRDNCTHVIVLRTRADDQSVTVKMGTMEKMIMSRFFGRKLGLPHFVTWMTKQYHKLVYAEDVLILNDANKDFDDSSSKPKIFCLALPPGIPEVKRLETSREVIFNSVRQGFAAAYDGLSLDSPPGKGWELELGTQTANYRGLGLGFAYKNHLNVRVHLVAGQHVAQLRQRRVGQEARLALE